jgi:cytochrome c oxidase cbb3-type subunit 3
LERRTWKQRVETSSFEDLQNDRDVMEAVRQTGRTLFGDNCAACHGSDAKGNKGFPNLTTSSWLWGGDPETIAETVRVGVNSGHAESRVSQMPAFGRGGILSRTDVENVVAYVRTLSARNPEDEILRERIAAGQTIFAANCAACHGEDGAGTAGVGAPNLTDQVWLYGGDPQSVFTTVWRGREGHMPSWEGRLSAVDRKVLVLYLATLGSPAR